MLFISSLQTPFTPLARMGSMVAAVMYEFRLAPASLLQMTKPLPKNESIRTHPSPCTVDGAHRITSQTERRLSFGHEAEVGCFDSRGAACTNFQLGLDHVRLEAGSARLETSPVILAELSPRPDGLGSSAMAGASNTVRHAAQSRSAPTSADRYFMQSWWPQEY